MEFMDHLAYPVERRNIALDFDATASTNIPFWQHFVRMAHAQNYDVYIVTARHPNRIEEVKHHFEGLVKDIIATSHNAKQPFCQNMGLRIDIFIDDSPWNIYCNIDGSTPKFESLSFMHPDFGTAIADMIFPRNHPLKLRGYGFFFSDCEYEVPLIRQSFHRTKKGAYLAMRKFLTQGWEEWRKSEVEFPRMYDGQSKRHDRHYGPYPHAIWAIRPDTLEVNE